MDECKPLIDGVRRRGRVRGVGHRPRGAHQELPQRVRPEVLVRQVHRRARLQLDRRRQGFSQFYKRRFRKPGASL